MNKQTCLGIGKRTCSASLTLQNNDGPTIRARKKAGKWGERSLKNLEQPGLQHDHDMHIPVQAKSTTMHGRLCMPGLSGSRGKPGPPTGGEARTSR